MSVSTLNSGTIETAVSQECSASLTPIFAIFRLKLIDFDKKRARTSANIVGPAQNCMEKWIF